MKTVEQMFAEMKKIADEEGYQFNPVQQELDDILEGLWENEHRYGYLSCPCRIASGVLNVSEDWVSRKHDPIPERRPQEYYDKGYPGIMEQKGAGGKEMAEVSLCAVISARIYARFVGRRRRGLRWDVGCEEGKKVRIIAVIAYKNRMSMKTVYTGLVHRTGYTVL